MKNFLILLLTILSLGSCKKEASKIQENNQDNLLFIKQIYSRTDTSSVKQLNKKRVASSSEGYLHVVYAGSNYYTLKLNAGGHQFVMYENYRYTLYKNGVAFESNPIRVDEPFVISRQLSAGVYYLGIVASGFSGDSMYTASIEITDKPTAPAGMLCLYGYYNPVSGQHLCTYDWEELGSVSLDFRFEKVLGYTYPSASSAPNLKPIYRYYSPNTGSHYTTGIYATYPGLIYEKILGYVGASAGGNLTRPLTKYYNRFLDDHFVCVPPEVPLAPDYVADNEFIFGYVQ